MNAVDDQHDHISARRLVIVPLLGAAGVCGLIGLADHGWHYRVAYSTFWGGVIGLAVGVGRVCVRRRAVRSGSSESLS